MDIASYILEIFRLEALEKWYEAEILCGEVRDLAKNGQLDEFPHEVWHFLSDWDIRQRDHEYAVHQRLEVRELMQL